MQTNLNSYFSDIQKNGYGLSVNWSFISLYANETYIDPSISYQNAAQLASFLCSYNSSISDILVVDTKGNIRSYFAGVSYDIISNISISNLFYDSTNVSRDFYFFPEDSEWNNNYFVYYAPIFNPGNSFQYLQKSASAVFLCNKKKLQEILNYNAKYTGEYYAIYYQDNYILSNTGQTLSPLSFGDASITLPLSVDGLKLIGIRNQPLYDQNKTLLFLFCTAILLSVLFLALELIYYNHRFINKPIWEIRTQLASFRRSDLNDHIHYTNIDELDGIVTDINAMIDELKTITKKIFSTQDKLYETSLRKTEAELYALQSQINPHFLNNTLQCIYGLASTQDYENIKKISLNLSDVFQYSISSEDFVRIEDEILIVYKYLHIYKLRFDGNLEYHIDIPDEILDYKCIKMIIQPLIENAIIHGYKNTDRMPVLYIISQQENNDLLFKVIDNGTGIPYNTLKEINSLLTQNFSESIHHKNAHGFGLYNINRRIYLTYGENYGLKIHSNMIGTEVTIRIPLLS